MTRRERWQIAWFVFACMAVTIAINWAIAQNVAQPRVPMRVGAFDFFEFENGSQWYLRKDSIQAIWGVPRGDQEKLAFKTKLFGNGYVITLPYEVRDVVDTMYAEQINELNAYREQLKVPPGRVPPPN